MARVALLLLLAACSATPSPAPARMPSADTWRPTAPGYLTVDAGRGARAYVPDGWSQRARTWRVHVPPIQTPGVPQGGSGEDLDVAWACQHLRSGLLSELRRARVEATDQHRPGLERLTLRLEGLRSAPGSSKPIILHLETTADGPGTLPLVLRVPVSRPGGEDGLVSSWADNRALLRRTVMDVVDALARIRGIRVGS